MNLFDEPMSRIRTAAAQAANAADADLWRWFSTMMDERRIRWCQTGEVWLVSVDHRHMATDVCFDSAIRAAKAEFSVRPLHGARRMEKLGCPL